MSGGDGGGVNDGSWRIGSGSPAGEDKCEITERTVLNSPVAAVVSTLNVGDVLLVQLVTIPRSRLTAVTAQGQIAGAITATRIVDIIECIQNGSAYEAQVLSINAGRVGIEIRLA